MNRKLLALPLLLPLAAAAFPPLPLDLDEDGRISREEWQEAGAMRFRAADRDLDGRLTGEEQRLLRPPGLHMALLPPPPESQDCRRGPRHFVGGAPVPEPPRDENSDGQIDRAEMEAASERGFAERDANADGWLDLEELRPVLP